MKGDRGGPAGRRLARGGVLAAAVAALAACGAQPAAPPVLVAAPSVGVAAVAPVERRVLLTVAFRRDSAVVERASLPVLDALAAALRDERLRHATLEVNGHADASGRLGHNVALSFMRASAVVDHLLARRVAVAALRAQGFGPLAPLHPDRPLDPANRRVEVVAMTPPMPAGARP